MCYVITMHSRLKEVTCKHLYHSFTEVLSFSLSQTGNGRLLVALVNSCCLREIVYLVKAEKVPYFLPKAYYFWETLFIMIFV